LLKILNKLTRNTFAVKNT